MGNTVLYILEWAFSLLLFLAVYKLCFSGTTLHRFNRCYLLGATVLSALLPLVAARIVTQAAPVAIGQTEFAHILQEVTVWGSEPEMSGVTLPAAGTSDRIWAFVLIGAWALYVIVLITGWTRSIVRTSRFIRGRRMHRVGIIRIVRHDGQYGPFSWMNCIVISDAENGFARRASLRHELSHIRLGHYADLVFLLACTIVNPVCWLIMKELKIVHEYEADDEVISRYGIADKDYQRLLIMRTVGAEAYALASSFNLNIKQRIIMMKKTKTLKRRMLYLFAVIPVIGITLMACGTSKNARTSDGIPADAQPLKAGQTVTGWVYDEDGNPVTAAKIMEIDEYGHIVAHDATDDRGRYIFQLAGEGHRLELSHAGYGTESVFPIVSTDNNFKLTELEHIACISVKEHRAVTLKFMGLDNTPEVSYLSMDALSRDLKKAGARKVYISAAQGSDMGTLSDVKKAVRKSGCKNIVYGTGHNVYGNRNNVIEAALITTPEEKPEFEGGQMALLQYLAENIRYPKKAREQNIQGRVLVHFTIETDGSITNAEVVRSVDPMLDAEALRSCLNLFENNCYVDA